jgi:hypothetical protein
MWFLTISHRILEINFSIEYIYIAKTFTWVCNHLISQCNQYIHARTNLSKLVLWVINRKLLYPLITLHMNKQGKNSWFGKMESISWIQIMIIVISTTALFCKIVTQTCLLQLQNSSIQMQISLLSTQIREENSNMTFASNVQISM